MLTLRGVIVHQFPSASCTWLHGSLSSFFQADGGLVLASPVSEFTYTQFPSCDRQPKGCRHRAKGRETRRSRHLHKGSKRQRRQSRQRKESCCTLSSTIVHGSLSPFFQAAGGSACVSPVSEFLYTQFPSAS